MHINTRNAGYNKTKYFWWVFLVCLTQLRAGAALINSRGLWDFDNTFSSFWSCFPAVTADGLTPGTDYSFADAGGYSFLQTQPFVPASKRLTVPNSTGPNGGVRATRTNQWSIVMDVRFDSLAPYAGIIQLDPTNAGDVTLYVNGADGSLTGAAGTLSNPGSIVANTWYRLAFTCGNNGGSGGLTIKAYINGILTGTRPAIFDGPLALRSTFLMLSDDSGELRPAKLNSLGLWGEELTAGDLTTLAGPRFNGLYWPGFSSDNCPVVTATPRAVNVGQNLNITFTTPSPSNRDRLALFHENDAVTAANVRRSIYIGGGTSPTTAPSGGMPVMNTAGLPAGGYWLHYLPGDTYNSSHRIAVRLDAATPVLTVSPSSIYSGGVITVSGAVAPGSPAARLLFKQGDKEQPVQTVPVDEWGRFPATPVTTPGNAFPAPSQIIVIPTGTTSPEKQSAAVTVAGVPLATLTVLVRRNRLFPNTPVVVSGVTTFVYRADGELAGQAVTDSAGASAVSGLTAGSYVVTCSESGSPVREFAIAIGSTSGTISLILPAISLTGPPPCVPSAEIVGMQAITKPGGLFTGSPATNIATPNAPVFASFAQVGPANGSQEIDLALTVQFDCADMARTVTLIPNGEFPKYKTTTIALRLTMPALYQTGGPVIVQTGTVVGGDNELREFRHALNVTNWPAGTPSLVVEAGYFAAISEDGTNTGEFTFEPFAGASWAYPMRITDLTPRWRSGKAANVSISATPDAATNSINYQFAGTVPTSASGWDKTIDLGLLKLENKVSFGGMVSESWSTTGDYTASANLEAVIKLLGFDVVKRSVAFQGLPPTPDGLLGLTYRSPEFSVTLADDCWAIPGLGIDARKCIKLCFVGCKKCVGISAGAFACINGRVDVEGSIASNLRARATITPHVTLSTPVRIQIDAVFCSGGGEIKPQLDFALPVNVDFDPLAGSFGPGSITLSAILNYYVKCFGFTLVNGSKNLAEKTWTSSGTPSGASANRQAAPNRFGTIESPVVSPAIATNAACRAMAVWTGDANLAGSTGPGQLYFREGNADGTWQPTGQVPLGGSLAENPAVAWLDQNRALCVWTHPKSTPAPPAVGEDASLPQDLELRWSIFQSGAWSAPLLITNDNLWDVRPVLASDGAGRATCVWQRLNAPVPPATDSAVPSILVASNFAGGTWSGIVSLAPGTPGTDYQASVRYDGLGNPGVVWLRDPDILSDNETAAMNHANQELFYVYKAGTSAWTAPQKITGVSPSAYSPSLDFDTAQQPCIAFLVPGINRLESTTALTGGGGNQSPLWFARRSAGVWGASQIRINGIFSVPLSGERPTLRIDNANRAIVVFRRFGKPGKSGFLDDAPVHVTGDVAIATASLPASGVSIAWLADFLTDDGKLNWQIAYDRPRTGTCGKMFWIKAEPDGDAAYSTVQTVLDSIPDPAILAGGLRVNNPHPINGQAVVWTTVVTNRGLVNAGGPTDPLRVEIRRDSPTGPLVGSGSTTTAVGFGGSVVVTITAAFPSGGQQRFFAKVLPPATQAEVTAANNSVELIVGGVAPPCNLVVSRAPKNAGTIMSWDVPAGTDNYFYRILRRTGSGVWEIIGYNNRENFCDPTAAPGVSYQYAVVAVDPSSGVISDACAPGFVVIPSLIPNDPGPLPALSISRASSISPVTLSWPDTDPLLYIERSPDPSAAAWSRIYNSTQKAGDNRLLDVPLQRPAEFFRLRRD